MLRSHREVRTQQPLPSRRRQLPPPAFLEALVAEFEASCASARDPVGRREILSDRASLGRRFGELSATRNPSPSSPRDGVAVTFGVVNDLCDRKRITFAR